MIRLFGAILFWGVATTYTATPGAVLYCDQFCISAPLIYTSNAAPWVAVTVEWYESGLVECGDTVTLLFTNGRSGTFRILDAGRFQGRWVQTWPRLPIRVDLPEFFKPDKKMSWLVIGIIYDAD